MSPLDGRRQPLGVRRPQPDHLRLAKPLDGAGRELLREIEAVEAELKSVHQRARMLPAMTARHGAGERERLVAELKRGRSPRPQWRKTPHTPTTQELRVVDRLRRRVAELPIGPLYGDKLNELELELCMLEALGRERVVRPLSARRFGTGDRPAPSWAGGTLGACAARVLSELPPDPENKTIPARAFRASRCLSGMMVALARSANLEVQVVVDPRLVAGAATGEHTVYIADRMFGAREARRLAVHEVLGHLLAAANGRRQLVRLLEWGTVDAFADQEGVALCLEAAAGLMDNHRLRTLAGRVCATDLMHGGATFGDTALHLVRAEEFAPEDAIALSERAYRGGGVARDVSYLEGYLRVRQAIARGQTDLDELRAGRLSVAAISHVRALGDIGLFVEPHHCPNLARSFFSTSSGTMPDRFPPSDAASLTRL